MFFFMVESFVFDVVFLCLFIMLMLILELIDINVFYVYFVWLDNCVDKVNM